MIAQLGSPFFWTVILALSMIMYVLLDGFDLGVGIIFPWIKSIDDRDIMMTSIAPLWDGNETWLVFATVILYAAFPKAYSHLLPTFYVPIMGMLVMLVLRGVTFEFRFKTERRYRPYWSLVFGISSTLASFCQGAMLGAFLQGSFAYQYVILSEKTVWLTPFSIMTGLGVIAGYVLLGAAWLIKKTTGPLKQTMIKIAKIALIITCFFMLGVSIWTPLVSPFVWHRWFSIPRMYYLALLPMTSGMIVLRLWYVLTKKTVYHQAFFLTWALFLTCFIGLAISIWPYIIPYRHTVYELINEPKSLNFLFWGVICVLPVLLIYTFYGYWVFRGTVKKAHAY
jgi:cytochrome bd ubiquinol oxidase subunit II